MSIFKEVAPGKKLLVALVIILVCAFIGGSVVNYRITKSAVHREIVQNDLPLTMNNIYPNIYTKSQQPLAMPGGQF